MPLVDPPPVAERQGYLCGIVSTQRFIAGPPLIDGIRFAARLQVLRYWPRPLIAQGLKLSRVVDTFPPRILMADWRGKSAPKMADLDRGAIAFCGR